MTGDIVNLLCHFIDNRLINHFWKCGVKHKAVKENVSLFFIWTPGMILFSFLRSVLEKLGFAAVISSVSVTDKAKSDDFYL